MKQDKKLAKHKYLPSNPRVDSMTECSPEISSAWRIFKIMGEFVSGFEFLKRYQKAVTFFGSARNTLPPEIYEETTRLARGLSKMGFDVITGGGPGLMEAANKGAYEAGGRSVGINIQLPHEQRTNRYVKESAAFHYFFTRKVMLSYASDIYVFLPGGFGTLDELFEILVLVQTRKIGKIPIILMNKEFWTPLTKWIEDKLLNYYQALDKDDINMYYIVSDAEEALDLVKKLVKSKKIDTSIRVPEYTLDQKIIK